MATLTRWSKGPTRDPCRNAAIIPLLHTIYCGIDYDAGGLDELRMDGVRRVWAEMAYKVAEWCGEDRIRISNLYSLVPSYFGAESVDGIKFTVGLDLMCGEIVDLGRVIEVIVHEKSIDLVTFNGMVSVILPLSDTGLDLATEIKLCMRRFDLSDGLPPHKTFGISSEAARVYSESTFVYNIDGRPMSARALADSLGCREDDVTDVLNTPEGMRMLELIGTSEFRDGGCTLTETEVIVYNFAETRARRVADMLGVPVSQVRVAPQLGPISIDDPVTFPLGQVNVICEGVSRSLIAWSAHLGVPVYSLARAWSPGMTEKEWVRAADPVNARRGKKQKIPMWVREG